MDLLDVGRGHEAGSQRHRGLLLVISSPSFHINIVLCIYSCTIKRNPPDVCKIMNHARNTTMAQCPHQVCSEMLYLYICTGCPKSHAPSLTRYIFRYENSIAIKEVCLDRVTLHNFCDTKHDPIDDLFTYLSKLKWKRSKYTKTYLKDPYLYF